MFKKNLFYTISIITIVFFILFFFKFNIQKTNNNVNTNNMIVHFIDVGQGDCTLIQVNNKNILIDAGPSDSKENIYKYFKSLNIKSFDYLIATHPHEDHIGNMAYIIDNYDVLNFYAPKITNNTKSFETMIESLVRKDLKINIIRSGTKSINLGYNTKVEVFSPISNSYENLNNYSPIIKIKYGNTSFLFTGDSEEIVESEVLNSNYDLNSDILKVGHHGSSTSTSRKFYSMISPDISVISVGKNNSYGHPTKEVLSTIKDSKVLRTDVNGTIVVISDGYSFK
jgi:competence protein ComEC